MDMSKMGRFIKTFIAVFIHSWRIARRMTK